MSCLFRCIIAAYLSIFSDKPRCHFGEKSIVSTNSCTLYVVLSEGLKHLTCHSGRGMTIAAVICFKVCFGFMKLSHCCFYTSSNKSTYWLYNILLKENTVLLSIQRGVSSSLLVQACLCYLRNSGASSRICRHADTQHMTADVLT